MLEVYDLKVNHLTAPLGIDDRNLRFSWKIRSNDRAVYQVSYRLLITCESEILWDSGKYEYCI